MRGSDWSVDCHRLSLEWGQTGDGDHVEIKNETALFKDKNKKSLKS